MLYDIVQWNNSLHVQRQEHPGDLYVDVTPANVATIALTVGSLVHHHRGQQVKVPKLFVNIRDEVPDATAAGLLAILQEHLCPDSLVVYCGERLALPQLKGTTVTWVQSLPCDRPRILEAAADPAVHGILVLACPYDDDDFDARLYVDVARLNKRLWSGLLDVDGFASFEDEVDFDLEPDVFTSQPYIVDLYGDFKPHRDGLLNERRNWFDWLCTMEPGGMFNHSPMLLGDVVAKEWFGKELTDDVVLACSVVAVIQKRKPVLTLPGHSVTIAPRQLLYCRSEEIQELVWSGFVSGHVEWDTE